MNCERASYFSITYRDIIQLWQQEYSHTRRPHLNQRHPIFPMSKKTNARFPVVQVIFVKRSGVNACVDMTK